MPDKRVKEERAVADILKMITSQPVLSKGFQATQVVEAWREVMGPGVNSYTTDVKLKGDVLYVFLKSSVLRQELLLGKTKIIKMLSEHCGSNVVKDIIFR